MLRRIIRKFRKPNHSGKRFINSCFNFISKSVRSARVWGYPESILIEPTNTCNLRCPLCPTGSGAMKRAKGFLTLDNFKKLIDEIADKTYFLTLSNYGEPFLNKDIVGMVAYAKRKGLIVNIVTNAQCITDDVAVGIVESGLDMVTVSLDAVDQQTYEKYRVAGQFSNVIEAIRMTVKAKEERGSRFPVITVQFIVMRHNEHQMDEFRKLARQLRVDMVIFKRLCDLNGFPVDLAQIEPFMPVNPAYRSYVAEEKEVKWNTRTKDRNFCPLAWNYPVIDWNGSLFPCCFDFDTLDMGNVFTSSFKEVWNGKQFIALRRQLRKDKNLVSACKHCAVNFYDEIIEGVPLG